MKSIILSIAIVLVCLIYKVHAQSNFEKIVSITDPVFEEMIAFTHLELYDERYLFFSAYHRDGYYELYQYYNSPFVYDLEKKRTLDISFDKEENIRIGGRSIFYNSYRVESRNSCRYNDGLYYSLGSNESVEFNLTEDKRNTVEGIALYDFIEYQGQTYAVSFSGLFQLYLKKDGNWIPFYQSDNKWFDAKGCGIYPLDIRLETRLMGDQLFIIGWDYVGVYDFKSNTDTFLADLVIRSSDVDNQYCEDLVQIQEYNGDLYIVRKGLSYDYGRIQDFFYAFDDKAVVWKVNGKSGLVEKLFEYDLDKKFELRNNSIQLIANEEGLYWIGISHESNKFQLFKVGDSGLEFLQDFEPLEDNVFGVINKNTYTNLSGANEKDIHSLIDEVIGQVKLWTIKGDSVDYLFEKSLTDNMTPYYDNWFFPVTEDTLIWVNRKEGSDSSNACLSINLINLKNQEVQLLDSLCTERHLRISDKPLMKNGSIYFIAVDGNLKEAIWRYSFGKPTSVKTEQVTSKNLLSLYPNPASQSITIQSTEPLNGSLIIVSTEGKIHQTFRVTGQQQQIDVSKLANGMYVAIYHDSSHTETQNFIIQR